MESNVPSSPANPPAARASAMAAISRAAVAGLPSAKRRSGRATRYAVSVTDQSVASRPRRLRFSSRSSRPSNTSPVIWLLAESAFRIGLRIFASPIEPSMYVRSRAGFPTACVS